MEKIAKRNKFSVRSELMQEVFAKKPPFIEIISMPILFIIITGLAIATFFIDVTSTKSYSAFMKSNNLPLTSTFSGPINYYLKDGDSATAGDPIAGTISINNLLEIKKLSKTINNLQRYLESSKIDSFCFSLANLEYSGYGEVNSEYLNLKENALIFCNSDFSSIRKIRMLADIQKSLVLLDNWLESHTVKAKIAGKFYKTLTPQISIVKENDIIGTIETSKNNYYIESPIPISDINQFTQNGEYKFRSEVLQKRGFSELNCLYLGIDNSDIDSTISARFIVADTSFFKSNSVQYNSIPGTIINLIGKERLSDKLFKYKL